MANDEKPVSLIGPDARTSNESPVSRTLLALLTSVTTGGVATSLVGLAAAASTEIRAICIAGLSLAVGVYGLLAALAARRNQEITIAKARAELLAALAARDFSLSVPELEQAARDMALLQDAHAGEHVRLLNVVLDTDELERKRSLPNASSRLYTSEPITQKERSPEDPN